MGLFGNMFGRRPQFANADPNAQMGPSMAMPGAQMQPQMAQPQPSGLFGQQAQQQLQQPMSEMVQQPAAKPKFFAEGGAWDRTVAPGISHIAAVLRDDPSFLLQEGKNRADVEAAQTDYQQKALMQHAQGMATAQREREMVLFKNDHPGQDDFQRTLDAAGITDPAQRQAILAQRANTMATHAPQYVPNGSGGGQWLTPPMGPQTGGMPAQGGGVPHVTDAAGYAALPPGATYQTPDGHTRQKPGGAASNGGSTFQW